MAWLSLLKQTSNGPMIVLPESALLWGLREDLLGVQLGQSRQRFSCWALTDYPIPANVAILESLACLKFRFVSSPLYTARQLGLRVLAGTLSAQVGLMEMSANLTPQRNSRWRLALVFQI